MSTSNTNIEMKQAADYAVRMAKKRFGQELDYSEDSLFILEKLVEQACQQFGKRNGGGEASTNAINHTAIVWGSYLGEVMHRKWGGDWIIGKESNRSMVINDTYFSPINYVYQRITGQFQDNVKQYFDEIASKLSSKPINFVQLQTSNNKKGSLSVERILQIVLGAALLFLMVVAANWLYSSKISAPAIATQQASYVIATQIACHEEFLDSMTRLLSDFFRQQSIADVTPRINLPEQIARLEDIRGEAWNIPEKKCESKLHALLMDYMDKSIAAYIGFSGNEDDYTFVQEYATEIKALIRLDDEIKSRGYREGLVGLFRNKGYFYWEKLDDPYWRSSGGGSG